MVLFDVGAAIVLTIALGPAYSDPRHGITRVLTIGAFHFLAVDLLIAQVVARLIVKVHMGVHLDLFVRQVVTVQLGPNVFREGRKGHLVERHDL
ncbi:hypothetical protein AGJNDGAI_00004 [Pseudomonas phage phi C106]|nr:hypothetical protein AGJNDGAI_00004 [Pseudomonas phage phi C106]